ncbi:MAG: ADP-ribosylglycohydrolase family protein [Promethearchaeota archaeon]
MIGSIAGDIIGSKYERFGIKTTKFEFFSSGSHYTDDTVLSIALADSILNKVNFPTKLKEYCRRYPKAGYGGWLYQWAMSDSLDPYNSFGNGSAMRVSPIGFAYDDLETVLKRAKQSAEATHNHPEGIKGAQAIASCIFLARTGNTKNKISDFIEDRFKYDLSRSIDEIRPHYNFDVTCQGSVPQAIRAFLESDNYEHSIRLALSLGGDSDTIGCMNGGIAQAYYGGVPEEIKESAFTYLDNKLMKIVKEFCEKFNCC